MAHDNSDAVTPPGITSLQAPHDFPPPAAFVKFEYGAYSRQGSQHEVNEDHYLIVRLGRHQETLRTSLPASTIPKRYDEYGYGMVVADGMGGGGAGETASRIAISTLVHLLLYFGKWNLRIDDQIAREIMDRAERFYRYVDDTMLEESRTGPMPGLRTTLTAGFSAGTDLFMAHVGHSRAYLCRDGELLRLTHDHTIGPRRSPRIGVAPLVDVNATSRDLRHILTETIGMGGAAGPAIDLRRVQLKDNDHILLCTNGVSDNVDEEVMAEVLVSDRTPDDMCQTIVDLAMLTGGEDDATAVVTRYRIPG